jgi:hypothetical protein
MKTYLFRMVAIAALAFFVEAVLWVAGVGLILILSYEAMKCF